MKNTALFAAVLLAVCMPVRAENAATIANDDALPYLAVDIENKPGWIAHLKGGYQWKFFRGAGLKVDDGAGDSRSHERNHTRSGGVGSASFGYNFGPRLPLTLGIEMGVNPSSTLRNTTTFTNGDRLHSRQRIRIFTLDLAADYNFCTRSRWTPFVGVTAGAAFTKQKASAWFQPDGGDRFRGDYSNRSRVNFMTGARLGVKYDVTRCITLSLYGAYNYLGSLPGKRFTLADGAGNTLEARTLKVRAHSLDLKAGLQIRF